MTTGEMGFTREGTGMNELNRAAFHRAMRELLRDLNSVGEKPYTAHVGSRLIAVDSAVIRYMIDHMDRAAFPDDVQA